MYSIPIQDILFTLADGSRIDACIESYSGPFGAEAIFPILVNGHARSLSRMPLPTMTAQKAFEWIVEEVYKYGQAFSVTVAHIDNPCNEPFLTRAQQQPILAQAMISAPILLNGKP